MRAALKRLLVAPPKCGHTRMLQDSDLTSGWVMSRGILSLVVLSFHRARKRQAHLLVLQHTQLFLDLGAGEI
jgi:hypothetical protein